MPRRLIGRDVCRDGGGGWHRVWIVGDGIRGLRSDGNDGGLLRWVEQCWTVVVELVAAAAATKQ